MTYKVIFETQADEDLLRLHEHLLERAESVEDLEIANRAIDAIQTAVLALAVSPMLFRKRSGGGPLRRELVVPFGSAGYVIEYEVAGPDLVVVLAIRHQREQDLH
jgi:plasmid stabilization system protein ParE